MSRRLRPLPVAGTALVVVAVAASVALGRHADRVDASRRSGGAPPRPSVTAAPHADTVYPSIGRPGVDAVQYDLALDWWARTRTLHAVARVRLRALHPGSFTLDMAQPLHVRALHLRDARSSLPVATRWTHEGRSLVVSSSGILPGSTYDLTVRYSGSPRPVHAPTSRSDDSTDGWHTTKRGTVWTMQEPYGAFTWYPVHDHPSDKATYAISVTAPATWVGVSNGRLRSDRVAHGRRTTRFTTRDPMASYLTTVAIGPYVHATQTGPHGLPLSYWVPRSHRAWLRPLRETPRTLRWLEGRLGRFPFEQAGVVITPGSSGMETQTMITLGDHNLRKGRRNALEVLAHELAHAWYGDTVTPDDWRDVWMNEGMAMYLEARYTVHEGWYSWTGWRRVFAEEDAPARRRYGPPAHYERDQFAQLNVYYCPARMWLRLRHEIGAHKFDDLLRRWPQQHRNSVQDRHSYTAWYAAESGHGWSWFRPWLLSPRPVA